MKKKFHCFCLFLMMFGSINSSIQVFAENELSGNTVIEQTIQEPSGTGDTQNENKQIENTKETREENLLQNTDQETQQNEEEEEEEDILDMGDDTSENDALKNFSGVVRQSRDYTCGPAALATLITQLGEDTGEQNILDVIEAGDLNEETGVSLLTLKKASEKLGNQTYLKNWSPEEVLRYVSITGNPVLIHDEKLGVGGHFSVIKEYFSQTNTIELSDTEAGNITYSFDDFKKVYTGKVLVISNEGTGESEANILLQNTSTDISDEEASHIWGKFTPVYQIIENSGNKESKAKVAVFKTCIKQAMLITDKTKRNAARSTCYNSLGKDLSGNLNYIQEAALFVDYKLESSTSNNLNGIDTQPILASLNFIKERQRNYIAKQTENDQLAPARKGYAVTQITEVSNYFTTIEQKLNKVLIDKQVLESGIVSKTATLNALNTELNQGSFVSNGQTFYLGNVESLLKAQSSTYTKLSSSMTSKLSSIDGIIAQKVSQISTASKSKQKSESNLSTYQAQMKAWQNEINKKKAKKQSTTYEQSQYNAYQKLASQEQTNIASYTNQINIYNQDIQDLNRQKSSIQTEVNAANAEKARLERLKSFGDQELARKKSAKATLETDIISLKKQLADKGTYINTNEPEVTKFRGILYTLNRVQSNTLDQKRYEAEITTEKARYGFATITVTNISETERLIAEELSFQKTVDEGSLNSSTNDFQNTKVLSLSEIELLVASKSYEIAKSAVVQTVQDGKVCILKGGVQECLSTCGVTLDYGVVTSPVAMMCDMTNGIIYVFQGDYPMAGVQALAVLPVAGTWIKGGLKGGMKLTKEAEESIVKQAAKNTGKAFFLKNLWTPKLEKHLFQGEIISGKFAGFHYNGGKIKKNFSSSDFIDSKIDYSQFKEGDIVVIGKTDKGNGFYEAQVAYFDNARYLSQKNQPGQVKPRGFLIKETNSTFFPDDWSKEKIKNEIAEAYGNMKLADADKFIYEGFGITGQQIRIVYKNNIIETAYPYFLTK